jgi:hypothetical protein
MICRKPVGATMSKTDRINAYLTLKNRLFPLLEKSLELDSINEDSTLHLKKSNQVLREIISELFKYLRVTEIIEELPTNQGNKSDDKNQQILEAAFDDYWEHHNCEPNEPEWYEWLENERYNPNIKSIVAVNNKFHKTRNGWGKEKIRKDLARFKSIEYKIMKELSKVYGTI